MDTAETAVNFSIQERVVDLNMTINKLARCRSVPMVRVVALVRRLAARDTTVLITGPTGVGKELVARAVHDMGPRSRHRFVAFSVADIAPTLIEDELFGHERGSFTNANTARAGLLRSAGDGTVFIDEIGELPLELQAKLLRVLQEREVRPIGGDRAYPIEARFVFATKRDLAQMVAEGKFREDLYYRLNVVPIVVPALRDRREDILPIANAVLSRLLSPDGQSISFDASAQAALLNYDWPGNVRELESVLQRALLEPDLDEGEVISEKHLGLGSSGVANSTRISASEGLAMTVESAELAMDSGGSLMTFKAEVRPGFSLAAFENQANRTLIIHALASEGSQTRAAALLGISRRILSYKMKLLGIPMPERGREE